MLDTKDTMYPHGHRRKGFNSNLECSLSKYSSDPSSSFDAEGSICDDDGKFSGIKKDYRTTFLVVEDDYFVIIDQFTKIFSIIK